jgi:hypothetical protein
MVTNSNAAVIRQYAAQLLSDRQAHSRSELFSYVRAQAPGGDTFTEGMLTGALRSLVNGNPRYQVIGRGIYQELLPGESEMQRRGNEILCRMKRELETSCTVNLLELSEGDFHYIQRIKKLIEYLHQNFSID